MTAPLARKVVFRDLVTVCDALQLIGAARHWLGTFHFRELSFNHLRSMKRNDTIRETA